MDPDELDDAVMIAAVGGDAKLATLLVERAAARIASGDLDEAVIDLGAAANLHRESGHSVDESRVRQALSTVQRTLGTFDVAEVSARRARELAPAATPFAVAAATELGEVLLLTGRHHEAVDLYLEALGHGAAIGMIPVARAALHRRMAIAHALAADYPQAALEAAEAAELYAESGHAAAATRSRIESATALVEAGLGTAATRAIADARVGAPLDFAAQAELDLLESARALLAKDAARALASATSARQHALDGNALLPYVAAALAIADLLERAGDRVGAYRSLAVGWVTAGDKIGNDLAATMFRAPLEAQRSRWGVAAFDAVKAEYYATRS